MIKLSTKTLTKPAKSKAKLNLARSVWH